MTIARQQLPRTLALSFVVGVAIMLLKDLGTLLSDGIIGREDHAGRADRATALQAFRCT